MVFFENKNESIFKIISNNFTKGKNKIFIICYGMICGCTVKD
jgi:hypothetical protein